MELEPSRVEERFELSDAYNGVWGESCIFNLQCAPFDTPSDLVNVPCGLRRRNITREIHYD
jgi:hypothetical protein